MLIIGFLFCLQANGQGIVNGKISVELLKEDFKMLRNKLESSQPGLYLYTSKDSLDKIFGQMDSSLNEPMTSLEFFRRIAPLNKVLRNLHTLFWASEAYEKGTETNLPWFPLDVHWDDGRMYVLRNNSTKDNIELGSVIKSINGVSAEVVFNKLLEAIRTLIQEPEFFSYNYLK